MVPRPVRFRVAVRLLRCVVLGLLLGICGLPTPGATPARAIVLLAPGLRVEDLPRSELPALRLLIREGATGLLVCRTAPTADRRILPTPALEAAAQALTFGSGARAVVPRPVSPAAMLGTVHDPTLLPREVLRLLQTGNAALDHPVAIGALGDTIRRSARTVAVLADAPDQNLPLDGILLAMDSDGRVDTAGARLHRVRDDPAAPYGVRADIPALIRDIDTLPVTVTLVVVRLGEIARADAYAPLCLPSIAHANRIAALRTLNALLEAVRSRVQAAANARVMLLAPPISEADPIDRLTPIVLWGVGRQAGVITSPSTRRDALAANTDVLPTLLGWLNLPPPAGITGRSIEVRPGAPQTPESLHATFVALAQTARLQNALGGLPTVQAMLVLAACCALWRNRRPRLAAAAVVAGIALPLGMLLLPVWTPTALWSAALMLALWTVVCAALAFQWAHDARRQRVLVQMLCGALVVTIVLDLCTGSVLLQRAWMSYSVVEAARYYGIGNEYMGAVIGAMCVLFALAPASSRGAVREDTEETPAPSPANPGIPLLLLALAAVLAVGVMGAPALGAKVGAAPSAGIAFGTLLLFSRHRPFRMRDLLGLLAAIAALLALFALVDLRGAHQTHFIRSLTGGGGDSLAGIAQRKLALEAGLLVRSPWSAALCVAAGALWLLRHTGALRPADATEALPSVRAALAGVVSGAVASVVCNDSGVTAAALILIYGWALAVTNRILAGIPPDTRAKHPDS